MRRTAALLLAALLGAAPACAQEPPGGGFEGAPTVIEDDGALLPPDTELIDIPTAAVLDLSGFSSRTRFFSSGGMLEWLSFGVYPRVNIGASFNIDKLVGTSSPVQITRPELQLKFRFFDGDRIIPAFAMGFDGQGILYNRQDKAYNQRQRGLYFVGSQEIGLRGLEAHAGMAISDFDSNAINGMMALSYNVQDRVRLMTEWDNINDFYDSRVNMGMRVYVTPKFNFEFSIRAIGQGGDYPNGMGRGPERIAQFKYTGNF